MMHLSADGQGRLCTPPQNGARLQIYVRKDAVPDNDWKLWNLLDLGDMLGAEGYLFLPRPGTQCPRRKTHLAKTLLSMPKFHGLEKTSNALPPALPRSHRLHQSRNVFVTRANIVSSYAAL